MQSISYVNNRGEEQRYYLWPAPGTPRAVVQIVHGMAEHAMRYQPLALALNEVGITVAAHDQAGHGSAAGQGQLGDFGDAGWQNLMDDVFAVSDALAVQVPGVPLVLFGHSMGSFVCREAVIQQGKRFKGLILCGTGHNPPALCTFGKSVAAMVSLTSAKKPSKLLQTLSFRGFNDAFKPLRTNLDWLTRDTRQVDLYVADPLCGFPLTARSYRSFFEGLKALTKLERLDKVPGGLPILIISGDKDPVGNGGKGPKAVAAQYRQTGQRAVTVKLYPDARHELVNEINRDEVTRDIIAWLDQYQ